MHATDTRINCLHVRVPKEAAQQVQLRLSAQLNEADLRPPGLAPSQLLLVKHLPDPSPGCLRVDSTKPMLDRSWERAVRGALTDCLRRAVLPTNGRVPPGAEAVLFCDEAEAWACWGREQVVREPSVAGPWWMQSIEVLSGAPAAHSGESPGLAEVWQAYPHLVPAMAAHLALWNVAEKVLRQMSEAEAEDILRTVCTTFKVPTPQVADPRAEEEEGAARPSNQSIAARQSTVTRDPPEDTTGEAVLEAAQASHDMPPWRRFVEEIVDVRLAETLARYPPAHRQLLGVALALRESPVAVRSRTFQWAWRGWQRAADRSASEGQSSEREIDARSPVDERSRSSEDLDVLAVRPSGDVEVSHTPDMKDDSSVVDALIPDTDRRAGERETRRSGGKDAMRWEEPYAVTEIGGVLYLVNVLQALDLPGAATTPPVSEYVGAWAVLEVMARTLLGTDGDTLRPHDPLWRVLATLDGRRPEIMPGRALDEVLVNAEDWPESFRIPPAWLDEPHVDGPVDGAWTVTDGRLRVWTDLGCTADLEATDDPRVQAETEWARFPNTRHLQHADTLDTMPLAPTPVDCAQALAWWAARTTPYVRHRLAAALAVDDQDDGWLADLFGLDGKLYATDTHVDLVFPLGAAHIAARSAGLDRSPGWWAAGGRVVRFHFRGNEA